MDDGSAGVLRRGHTVGGAVRQELAPVLGATCRNRRSPIGNRLLFWIHFIKPVLQFRHRPLVNCCYRSAWVRGWICFQPALEQGSRELMGPSKLRLQPRPVYPWFTKTDWYWPILWLPFWQPARLREPARSQAGQ